MGKMLVEHCKAEVSDFPLKGEEFVVFHGSDVLQTLNYP